MKRNIKYVLVACFFLEIVLLSNCKSQDLSEVAKYIKIDLKSTDYYSTKDDTSTLAKLIKPEQLDTIYDEPGAEAFDYITHDNIYALLFDIDNDQVRELIFFQLEGSMRNPILNICKFNKNSNKYKLIRSINMNVYPLVFKNHLYMLDHIVDFNTKHLEAIIIYDFTSNYELKRLLRLPVKYTYEVPINLKPYIRNVFLESLDSVDQGLRIEGNIKFYNYQDKVVKTNNYTLTYNYDWTSVGYYPSLLHLSVNTSNGLQKDFKELTGFDIIDSDKIKYLILSKFILSSRDLNIEVLSLDSLKTIEKGTLKTEIGIDY
jgi:hypothetical protein